MVVYKKLSSKVSRRNLTSACLMLGTVAVAESLSAPFRFFIRKGSINLEPVSTDSYKVSWICSPKNCSQNCTDVNDFWSQFDDPVAFQLNNFFRQQGWLIKDASELSPNRQTAILTKQYKSKFYYNLYHRIWNQLSRGNEMEFAKIEHTHISSHLF